MDRFTAQKQNKIKKNMVDIKVKLKESIYIVSLVYFMMWSVS